MTTMRELKEQRKKEEQSKKDFEGLFVEAVARIETLERKVEELQESLKPAEEVVQNEVKPTKSTSAKR
jgi:flagellar hook-basal body complex protein FliE